MEKRQIVLILVLNLMLELVLKSSNLVNLVLLDLLVLTATVLIQKNSSMLLFILLLMLSIITEFFGFKLIGVIGLSWFLSLLTVKIIGNFIHTFNFGGNNLLTLLLIYLIFVSFRVIICSILFEQITFQFTSIVLNIFILILYNWIINKFYHNKYVLER